MLTKNKFYIFCLITIILFLLVLISMFTFFKNKTSNNSPELKSKPTENSEKEKNSLRIDAQPGTNQNNQTIKDKERSNRDYFIGQIIKKLPLKQTLFELSYNINENSFILKTKGNDKDQVINDVNKFLKEENVNDISWLYNLTIE